MWTTTELRQWLLKALSSLYEVFKSRLLPSLRDKLYRLSKSATFRKFIFILLLSVAMSLLSKFLNSRRHLERKLREQKEFEEKLAKKYSTGPKFNPPKTKEEVIFEEELLAKNTWDEITKDKEERKARQKAAAEQFLSKLNRNKYKMLKMKLLQQSQASEEERMSVDSIEAGTTRSAESHHSRLKL